MGESFDTDKLLHRLAYEPVLKLLKYLTKT